MKKSTKKLARSITRAVTRAEKRKYTMTPAALAQRKAAPRKPNAVHDWACVRVAAVANRRAKDMFGSVNRALESLAPEFFD